MSHEITVEQPELTMPCTRVGQNWALSRSDMASPAPVAPSTIPLP